MWKNLFLAVFSLALLNLSKEMKTTALPGENKVLLWTINPLPPSEAVVTVLHPEKIGLDYASLYSVRGMSTIKADNRLAERVNNTINNNVNTGHIEFTLNDIRKEDGGEYRTNFFVQGGETVRSVGVMLIVYVKPSKPNIIEVSSPVAKKDMVINCVTQSNTTPVNHGLQMKYKWYRNGTVLYTGGRYAINGSQLQVKDIQRSDDHTVFSCEAFETESLLSDISAVYSVVAQYGPDPITISPSEESYTLNENDHLNEITCISSCYPACSYTWERDGNKESSGQVLNAIENIKRGQAGQYTCKVTNKHGNKESSVNIIVQYIPDVPVLTVNDINADVRERLPIKFNCTTKSVPPAKLTIQGSNMTALDTKYNTITSTFTIPHANCLDTGLFYCSAVNSIGNSKSNGVNVNVLCKPRPDHRVSQELKQGLASGDTMNISGTLISNPRPNIYWSIKQNRSSVSKNLTNNKEDFVFQNYWKIPTMTFQATKSNMSPEDFGEYSMHASNEYGNSVIVFNVTKKLSPDGPELISLLCKHELSVEIKFKPHFDGGDAQRFSIGMKSESNAVFKNVGKTLTDNNQNEMKLTGPILEPGVLYTFQVSAANTYGSTSSINTLQCTIEKESNMGAIIGGATAGGIFIIIVVIILVILLKRRSGNEKSDVIEPMYNGPGIVIQDHSEDGMKPNILYESAGPRDKETDKNGNAQKETSVNAVYAEVVKPKNKKANNDVYAEVVKPKVKGKPDGKKGKGKEKKSKPGQENGDVYENAPKKDASKERPSRRTNNQGLVYIDVEIKGKDTNQKKNVIHGIQNKNEYADVDFTQRADPLPSDDEDDTTPEITV